MFAERMNEQASERTSEWTDGTEPLLTPSQRAKHAQDPRGVFATVPGVVFTTVNLSQE